MKKILSFLLCLVVFQSFAQDYSPVLDLLINNKREEARKLFDKQFSKKADSNIDLLFLDVMIDQELGKTNFDESMLKKMENLPNSPFFIDPFINDKIILSNISNDEYDDLVFKKVDFLANSPKFNSRNIINYRKGVYDKKRLKDGSPFFNKLNAINNWQLCGVFENLNSSGLDTEYEPELYAKNDKLFNANSNGFVGWYTTKTKFLEGYHYFINEGSYGNGIIYAQTFIDVPADKTYLIQFGCSSGIKLFIDDVEFVTKDDTGRTNLDAFNYAVPLKKGTHRLLVKIETSGSSDYFSTSVVNTDFSAAKELTFSNTYKAYTQNSFDANDAVEKELDFEKYFRELVEKNPNNILYKIYLFNAYEANNKKEKAYEAIEGLDEKYSKSSFIAKLFARYYALDNNTAKVNEINKNIENTDKNYYYTTLIRMKDTNWLESATIPQLEEEYKKAKQFKEKYYSLLFEFFIKSRKSDIDGMFVTINEIIADSNNSVEFQTILSNLYKSLKNDKTTSKKILDDINSKFDDLDITYELISVYNDANDMDMVKKLLKEQIERKPAFNFLRNSLVDVLIDENKYDEALKLIDENLAYFPYSFDDFEKKATIYSLQNNKKEAENYLKKALSHYSSSSSLRKKLYDLTNTPDEITEVEVKDVYDFISKNRNTKLVGDYGITTLLSEFTVNILLEGGRKSKSRFVYVVTSESGIEDLKEYSLNTYSVNLLKSEIVKKNGSIVPAEKGGSVLVFPNLEVGDVVYIEYDYVSNSYGRFYNDFNLSFDQNDYYPTVQSYFNLIHSPDLNFNVKVKNGDFKPTIKKVNNKKVSQWSFSNVPSLPIYESYAPNFEDINSEIFVGTIDSWGKIANWYADLVKKNKKFDKITSDAYNKIFPNGIAGLSETDRATKIYAYIEDNITYSSLDFRQSGYVPQKPSKTLETKLGDCKDLSTLFVTLGEKANLDSNLVLVLTNNNGINTLQLPSKDFNHCIVKVNLEGKEYFVEMTDKYLPFKAMPMSLINANALVIHFDKAKNDKAQLINISGENAVKNVKKSLTKIKITEDSKEFDISHNYAGLMKSYYNELYSSATSEDVRKKEFEDNFNSSLNKSIIFKNTSVMNPDKYGSDIQFNLNFTVNEKLQQLGSLKIVEIPFFEKVYTKDIVNTEERKYPINYLKYENSNVYESEVELNIPEGKKFIEIPENKTFKYKNDTYSITYNLINPNKLMVKRSVYLSWNDIPTTEYVAFKKYVEEVLEAENQIVGYK